MAHRVSFAVPEENVTHSIKGKTAPLAENNIPYICPKLDTPWPIILGDANDVYKINQPSPRFVKRMKISTSNTLDNLVRIQRDPHAVDERLVILAKKRREDFVPDESICEPCNAVKVFDSKQADCVCLKCAEVTSYNVTDTSYRAGVHMTQPYLYKRSNHFLDHLHRVQGKQMTAIDPELLNRVRQELDKRFYGETDYSCVTPEHIRGILKTLNKAKWYNNCVRIWAITTGGQPPQMTQLQEMKLLDLFKKIQEPWMRHRPSNRKNMLSYCYLINKMCNLLAEEDESFEEIAQHFKLLKSKDKVACQDVLWCKICEELNLKFTRSVF